MKSFRDALVLIVCAVILISCNNESSGVKKGPSLLDGLKAPEGFYLERATTPGLVKYPMFASFDAEGRLFVFESDGSTPSTQEMQKKPVYFIRLLQDTNSDGIYDSSSIFADSLTYPKGGVFYRGSLYVSSSPDFLKLTDTDGDGSADKKEVLLTGWVLNHNGALLGGPFFGPDGWMYLTDARRGFDITTKEGKRLQGKSARIWRCKPDGSHLESYCGGGFDNAVELAFMPSGETVGTMTYFTDPQGGFRDALMHWVEGGVYPKPLGVIEEDNYRLTGDLMPVMTKTARVAPSGLMRYRNNTFGEDFTGNLFSAEFNTGRIMRHRVRENGGTYRTEDEPFVSTTAPDIHLTDVVEDVDGSMLIVNTGGWFIAGCPLSRVAKTDIYGRIYRLRKNNTESGSRWMSKPALDSLSPEKIVEQYKDAPPLIRDAFIEKLVENGSDAVEEIKQSLLTNNDAEIRAAAVFALYRINTQAAIAEVRNALDDKHPMVRTAAVRCIGLAEDNSSITKLIDIVTNDAALQVRRQAATALGQLKDNRVSAELVRAAANNNDRFLEHAIIYSLISLNNPSALIAALNNDNAQVKKAAIIALDQVYQSPMQKQHLGPLLMSNNTMLSNTAAWIITRRKEWPELVLNYLNERLSRDNIPASQRGVMRNMMISFSGEKHVQQFLAQKLTEKKHRSLITEVISNSPVKKIPASWTAQLGTMIATNDPEVGMQALEIIETRAISELNPVLKQVAINPDVADEMRLKALNARIVSMPALSGDEFNLLLDYLSSKYTSPVRQQAARVLSSAQLTDQQLTIIAEKIIPDADVFLLSSLLTPFRNNSNMEAGKALVKALNASADKLENITGQEISTILSTYPAEVKQMASPLLEKLHQKNAERLTHLKSVESGLKNGDVGRGRKLFFSTAQCSTCHAIGNEGGKFGPDLTNIGEIRSQHDILEAILYPGVSFAREYETTRITTSTGTFTGIILQQFPSYLLLSTAPGQERRIEKSEIKSMEPHDQSLMPSGLEKLLTKEELADLMSYLTSLPDGMGGKSGE